MTPTQHSPESVQAWLTERFAGHVRLTATEIDPGLPFSEYGLESVGAVGFAVDIEDRYGVVLNAADLWDNPSMATLSRLVSQRLAESAATVDGTA
jgi:acyl carrier protein